MTEKMIKILLLFMTLLVTTPIAAMDVVPRISDREIIEPLVGLKVG